MIATTMLMPTERPIELRDIKQALLSFDHVHIPSPEDRELIPPTAYMMSSMPIPIPFHFNRGQVRPLGKTPNFDELTSKVLDQSKEASRQGSLVLRDVPTYPEGIYIGNIPLPEDSPNPRFIYQVYRELASYPEFMGAISRGLETLPPLSEIDIDTLSPSGVDDMEADYLPAPAEYNGFVSSEAERIAFSKLCFARLGATVKSLVICHLNQFYPYTSDPGVASVIQMLTRNTGAVLENTENDEGNAAFVKRLGLLHDIILSEFLDPRVFDELSVKDILKLRTKAWGKAREARTALAKRLRLLSIENQTYEDFEMACKSAIAEYREAQSELSHEWAKFRVRTYCDLGLAAISVAPGSEIVQKIIPLGTLEMTLIIGGVFFKSAKEKAPELLDLLKRSKEIKDTLGYALFRPYALFRR